MTPKINNKDIFSKDIEDFVLETNCSYLEAILHICEDRNMEPETAAKLLNPSVKMMVEREAADLHLISQLVKFDFE